MQELIRLLCLFRVSLHDMDPNDFKFLVISFWASVMPNTLSKQEFVQQCCRTMLSASSS